MRRRNRLLKVCVGIAVLQSNVEDPLRNFMDRLSFGKL